MDMDQALITFIEESQELLRQMEDALILVESDEHDDETVNAMFRAIHTIKGSAGLFGLESVVSFTHVVENLLEQVRSGYINATPELASVLLPCCDHIGRIIEHSVDNSADPDDELQGVGDILLSQLSGFAGMPEENIGEKPNSAAAGNEDPVVEADTWHISLRFPEDILRNGMDPASFIRYLGKLGSITNITPLFDNMPDAKIMDPETCYLALEIEFKSDATKSQIEEAFDFIKEDSRVRILSPNSRISDYIELIRELPEGIDKIGEILVKSGALTRYELDYGLSLQSTQKQVQNEAPLIGSILVDEGMVEQPVVDAAVNKQQSTRETKQQQSRLIRVQASKLDELINLVGELVIAGASTSLLAQRAGDPALQEATSTVSRLVEEIRDGALQLRMVQIGETFHRFQRIVRDVSKELGKDIELIISGGDTELDKTVVEKISDPLTHLVRNSIDHGIESADLRAARNKPARGHLRLNAYHDSGSIVIEVADDGGGLDKNRIVKKAIEQGLITSAQNLSDKEILNLIFEPGFSTSESVSNLSGRGVGMDVVRSNIEALRGSVDLDSDEGAGTTVRIRLPLTLAIIDGFLVGVDNNSYVVPLDTVIECVELSNAQQQALRTTNFINLRGEVLPFIRLRDLFGVDGSPPRRESIVVMQYGGQYAGLMVDTLMGEFQTVIKPMGKLFTHLKGIAGSTILGSGDVALILDVPSLVQRAANEETHDLATQNQFVAITDK